MEALTAVATSLLTVWDMVKQYEKDKDGQYPTTAIKNIRVLRKIKEGVANERKRKKT
jgi:cyclic pyranopterin phosphate synthase